MSSDEHRGDGPPGDGAHEVVFGRLPPQPGARPRAGGRARLVCLPPAPPARGAPPADGPADGLADGPADGADGKPEDDGEAAASPLESEEAARALLGELRQRHRDLDAAIEALEARGTGTDPLTVRRLKKRKLMLRDRIALIEDRLTPDIIA